MNRRDFIKRLAFGAAAVTVVGKVVAKLPMSEEKPICFEPQRNLEYNITCDTPTFIREQVLQANNWEMIEARHRCVTSINHFQNTLFDALDEANIDVYSLPENARHSEARPVAGRCDESRPSNEGNYYMGEVSAPERNRSTLATFDRIAATVQSAFGRLGQGLSFS